MNTNKNLAAIMCSLTSSAQEDEQLDNRNIPSVLYRSFNNNIISMYQHLYSCILFDFMVQLNASQYQQFINNQYKIKYPL